MNKACFFQRNLQLIGSFWLLDVSTTNATVMLGIIFCSAAFVKFWKSDEIINLTDYKKKINIFRSVDVAGQCMVCLYVLRCDCLIYQTWFAVYHLCSCAAWRRMCMSIQQWLLCSAIVQCLRVAEWTLPVVCLCLVMVSVHLAVVIAESFFFTFFL